MAWEWLIICVAVAAVVLAIRRLAFVPEATARRHLANGAVLIDVRNPEEFERGHVPGALNMPLPGLPETILRQFPEKDQILLVHCLSGGRSALAQRLLKREGYSQVFNLGSFRRAQRIADGRGSLA
jgi:phage shock protein E